MKGTIRSGHESTRQHAWKRLRQVVDGLASSHNASAEVDLRRGEPPVINDPGMVELIRRTGADLLGQDNIVSAPGWTAADDFAFYSEKCPSVYFRLGIRNEELGAIYPLHHPRFRVDEQALSIGAVVLCKLPEISCSLRARVVHLLIEIGSSRRRPLTCPRLGGAAACGRVMP